MPALAPLPILVPPTVGEVTLPDGRVVILNYFHTANWRSDCEQCQRQGKGGFGPAHAAMPGCKSGGHAHCTCDGCF